MTLKEILAANLRRLRHEKHLTQEELADHAGLSARYIGSLERGRADPGLTVVGRIADALGIEPSELIRNAPSPPRGARESPPSSSR